MGSLEGCRISRIEVDRGSRRWSQSVGSCVSGDSRFRVKVRLHRVRQHLHHDFLAHFLRLPPDFGTENKHVDESAPTLKCFTRDEGSRERGHTPPSPHPPSTSTATHCYLESYGFSFDSPAVLSPDSTIVHGTEKAKRWDAPASTLVLLVKSLLDHEASTIPTTFLRLSAVCRRRPPRLLVSPSSLKAE